MIRTTMIAALLAGSTLAAAPAFAEADAPETTAPPPAATARRGTGAGGRNAESSPRRQCGARNDSAQYRCVQRLCSQAQWKQHPQCVRLKATDRLS